MNENEELTAKLEKKLESIEKTDDQTNSKIGIAPKIIGLIVCAFLILYFFVMKYFGLYEKTFLRGFNFIFLASGILYALWLQKNSKIDYLKGLKIGAVVSLWAAIPFTIFVYIYLKSDIDFMTHLSKTQMIGEYLNSGTASGAIFFEGMVSGLIFTYIIMPYFKEE